jgi:hypothetical protein
MPCEGEPEPCKAIVRQSMDANAQHAHGHFTSSSRLWAIFASMESNEPSFSPSGTQVNRGSRRWVIGRFAGAGPAFVDALAGLQDRRWFHAPA